MNDWLRRCPTWQFVLIWGMALAIGFVVGGIAGQLWKHQIDWGEVAGLAVGGAAGGMLAATAFRVNQQRS